MKELNESPFWKLKNTSIAKYKTHRLELTSKDLCVILNNNFFLQWFIDMPKILALFQLKDISYDCAEFDCQRFEIPNISIQKSKTNKNHIISLMKT